MTIYRGDCGLSRFSTVCDASCQRDVSGPVVEEDAKRNLSA